MKSTALLERISRWGIFGTIILLPLLFLPFTQDVLAYPKQILLIVLVFVSVVAWLAKAINEGELNVRNGWTYGVILLLLGAWSVSSLFSSWPYASVWGFPLSVSDSLLSFLAFSMLCVLVINSVKEIKNLFSIYAALAVSGLLAGIITLLQLYHVFPLFFAFTKVTTFNTVGTVNSVALISAALIPLCMILGSVSKLVARMMFWAGALLLLMLLVFANFFYAWVTLLTGLLILLGFGMWNIGKKTEFRLLSFPMALVVISLFFVMFGFVVPGSPKIPLEVSPSITAEIGILKNVIQQHPLVGSGPATYAFDYARYHSPLLNQTAFWGTRFTAGSSEIFDAIITKGILGGLALIFLIAFALWTGARRLLSFDGDSFSWMMGLGAVSAFGSLSIAFLFYPANIVMWMFFWLFLGAIGVFVSTGFKKFSLTPPSRLALAGSFVFLILLIFGLGLLFVQGQKYTAEIKYMKGVQAFQRGDIDQGTQLLVSAANFNPNADVYWRDLAQMYLAKVQSFGSTQNLTSDQNQQIQVAASNAITAAKQAVATAPANVANWNVQGFVYRNLIGVPGAENFAIVNYQKAVELEPNSPFAITEMGRVYLLAGQRLASKDDTKDQAQDAYAKAEEQLNKALALKQDYAPANFLLATLYDQEGKGDQAAKKLEEIRAANPYDTGIAFQLGVVYWQKGDTAKAQDAFERARTLDPNYANARYMLGLVYDRQGKDDRAMAEFRAVLALNQNNDEVKHVIANLAVGKPALDGITPAQPPISENPPELNKQGSDKTGVAAPAPSKKSSKK